MSRPILEVSGLTMRFGGLLAVNGVNLKVEEKQVVSMIGPNGAGKTTVFNLSLIHILLRKVKDAWKCMAFSA